MQLRERLLDPYPNMVIEYDEDMPVKMGGLYERYFEYPNGIITLADRLNYYMQNGHLAEEIGHHETSYGDITNAYRRQYNVDAARQELRARRYGHKLILPLERLIKCYEHGHWGDIYEMCLCLEIDRSHFKNIIDDYKSKFGQYVKYDGYRIQFEPLKIEEY
ncbi:hypothetical protein CW676_02290 [Macrococcoides caseolyticum]|uniref:Uncharacterized protein n=2 Tax=Macrococcoides caseolyticum TaxID=69966 RepID=A0ACC9MQD5_9STAP|nr:ImmA/IrrE family metallo-endopeptidase [Macrococcus caseolyticus]ARQ04360.1 hypothetical protein CA207_11090 [Macrococcus caseolyticus]PKE07344.1 hypothetical protein CW692_03520 [Macrococcus caseolyticus]PKE26131.1 hypothetical protein CW686_06375 [Macrococcus caseolyticus]PKE34668.1 hypothetical protein CW668_00270 [Macrococcus caseolyticus]PKE38533.1 hypothetical protein CW675_10795 [Macrococcus caseolyticus]